MNHVMSFSKESHYSFVFEDAWRVVDGLLWDVDRSWEWNEWDRFHAEWDNSNSDIDDIAETS